MDNITKHKREDYARLLKLYGKQPWLAAKEEALLDLFDLCDTTDEQRLIVDLLNRFTCLNHDEVIDALKQIANQIVNVWKLPLDKTQLVAITKDSYPDSAQMVVHGIKTPLSYHEGWEYLSISNNIDDVWSKITKKPVVVFIDEFAGTGDTFVKLINEFKTYVARRYGKIDVFIYVALIACMKTAKEKIENECEELFFVYCMEKGINEYYRDEEQHIAYKNMKRLESTLNHGHYGVRKFHSMGYKGSESLYSIQDYNTPNNVFPIFWWKYLSSGTHRNTVLNRLKP